MPGTDDVGPKFPDLAQHGSFLEALSAHARRTQAPVIDMDLHGAAEQQASGPQGRAGDIVQPRSWQTEKVRHAVPGLRPPSPALRQANQSTDARVDVRLGHPQEKAFEGLLASDGTPTHERAHAG